MSASIAAIAFPVAAAGALAAKSVGSAIEGFGSFLRGQATETGSSTAAKTDPAEELKDRVAKFQQQLASRIRNSGIATDSKVEVQLDEFGLTRAYTQGQENIDLSRWLSSEMDLVKQFADLQAQSGGPIAVQVDLAPAAISPS